MGTGDTGKFGGVVDAVVGHADTGDIADVGIGVDLELDLDQPGHRPGYYAVGDAEAG